MAPVFFITRGDVIPPQRCTLETSYRLAILGDKPNADSFNEHAPFAGAVGKMLWGLLSRSGVPRQSCYANNISPTSPFLVDNIHLESIRADLTEWRPNLVLLLGQAPLNLLLSGKNRIGDWRGSIFLADQFLPGQKCLATFHPSYVFVSHSDLPLLQYDTRRASDQSTTPHVSYLLRQFRTEVSPSLAILCLRELQRAHPAPPVAIDIEGGVDGLKCISFSQDPASGFVIPWETFTLEEQVMVAPALAQVLGDPEIPKVLQNSLYDNFVLSHVYAMPIRGILHDTMLSSWELYCELPKSLAVQASIWTLEPYWKGDKGAEDRRTLWRYCCLDSAVTLEIARAHAEALRPFPARLAHYRTNVALLAPALYMSLRGAKYDVAAASQAHLTILSELYALQAKIDQHIQEACPGQGCPSLNLHSPKATCRVLYDLLGYPVQHPKVGRRSDLGRRTADAEALASIAKRWPEDQFLKCLVSWRHLDKVRSLLATPPDPDNRVRCSYNVVGDEAGSLTCHGSPLGAGTHLSSLPRRFRHLIRADDGYFLFKCKLMHAEAWTVAAHYRRLGDEGMWNELMAGGRVHPSIPLNRFGGAQVWHQWVKDQLMAKGTLESASGQLRTFFGRRDASSTLADAIAHEPAANSAFALKLALLRLWNDDSNRAYRDPDPDRSAVDPDERGCGRPDALPGGDRGRGITHLVVEPLHAWGDGFLVQGPAERREWIADKLRGWFANPLRIADQEVTIPVEVRCGENWGEMTLC